MAVRQSLIVYCVALLCIASTRWIEGVDVQIEANYYPDANWVKLDDKFPKFTGDDNEPFFYVRGNYHANISLTNQTKEQMLNETVEDELITLHFQIWRTITPGCPKYLSVNSESSTNIDDGVWYQINKEYSNRTHFLDTFSIYFKQDCVESLTGFRNINLKYTRFYQTFDQDKNQTVNRTEQITKKCIPSDRSGCFLTEMFDGKFIWLPERFPWNMHANDPTYFTMNDRARWTLLVNDANHEMAIYENDICLRFAWFASAGANMSVLFGTNQIAHTEMVLIEGSVPNDTTKSTQRDLQPESLLCLKAYFPSDVFAENIAPEQFNITFVAQMAPENVDVLALTMIEVMIRPNELPVRESKYLTYEAESDINQTDPHAFSHQWPIAFPRSDKPDAKYWWSKSHDGFSFELKGQQRGTYETAYLESAWIMRDLTSRDLTDMVYLNFRVIIAKGFESDAKKLNVQIYLLDSNRVRLGRISQFTGQEIKGVSLDTQIIDLFAIPVNGFHVEPETRYKIQFKISYHDSEQLAAGTTILSLGDINFGDPCVQIDATEPSHRTWSERKCYDANASFELMPSDNIRCDRVASADGVSLQYQCACNPDTAGLSGPDCSRVDYCLFKHPIDKKNPSFVRTGQQFCNQDGKEPGVFCINSNLKMEPNYRFLCKCNQALEYFDFGTRQCKPISECLLNPCDLETQDCGLGLNDKKEIIKECYCKKGYSYQEYDDPKNPGQKISSCRPQYLESRDCDPKTFCGSDDANMKCILGMDGFHTCQCAKGFRRDGAECVSEMCQFPGHHRCPQLCAPTSTPPYYSCSCHNSYDLVTSGTDDDPKFECRLKANAHADCADKCTGKYQICEISGNCVCETGFIPDANDATRCIPSNALKLRACPADGRVRLNDSPPNDVVCDCVGNSSVTSSFFDDEDAAHKGSCKLTRTMCDEKQPGRDFCNSRFAACLLDANNAAEHHCQCPLGKLFASGDAILSAAQLHLNPRAECIDVCDLPFVRSQCASIGATCNAPKLWLELKSVSLMNVQPSTFCDCVPGTFYNQRLASCAQETHALAVNITYRWTHPLQQLLDQAKINLHRTSGSVLSQNNMLELIDPLNYGAALVRAYELNRAMEIATDLRWETILKRILLATEIEQLFVAFNLLESTSNGDIYREIHIVDEPQLLDDRQSYSLQVVLKIGPHLLANLANGKHFTSTQELFAYLNENNEITLKTEGFEEIFNNCHALSSSAHLCVIPYMQVVLGMGNIVPQLHKPCENEGSCLGMSNCLPLNGSEFQCECDLDYFDVESENNFKSSNRLVVFKNERCKSKALCGQSMCPPIAGKRNCLEGEPRRDETNGHWTKEVSCSCAAGFVADQTESRNQTDFTCISACVKAACSENGKCMLSSAHSAHCHCDSGYYGLQCEHSEASFTWWIVGVVLLSVLALAAIGAAIFFFRSSSSRSPSSSSSVSSSSSAIPSRESSTSTIIANVNKNTLGGQQNGKPILNSSLLNSPAIHEQNLTVTKNNSPNLDCKSFEPETVSDRAEKTSEIQTQPPEQDPRTDLCKHVDNIGANNVTKIESKPNQASFAANENPPDESGDHCFDENGETQSKARFARTAQSLPSHHISLLNASDMSNLSSQHELAQSQDSLTVVQPFTPPPRATSIDPSSYKYVQHHNRSPSTVEKIVPRQWPDRCSSPTLTCELSNVENEQLPSSTSPQPQVIQPTLDLRMESQQMNSDKFQHVRDKIALVLKLNSAKSFDVPSLTNSGESSRRQSQQI